MPRTKRVLIADDDECLVDVLARRCQAFGLQVERAYDGISALTKIDALEPHLIILDVNMPSGSGLSICEMVARDPDLKAIPTIILTGRADSETVDACKRLDAAYVLKGPSTWEQLKPLVFDLLEIDGSMSEPAEYGPGKSVSIDENHERPARGIPAVDLEAPSESDRIQDQYIAHIFAALGWSEVHPAEAHGDDRPEYAVTRPWVLCVDDDPDFAKTLKLRLQEHGVDVLHAFAGMEGYRFAFTHEAQAIILDQEMPDGNGEYILRRLKESPATEGIPVIVLTGTKDQALARRMYNLGATRFLTKPVDWEALWTELRPLIGRESEPTPLYPAVLN